MFSRTQSSGRVLPPAMSTVKENEHWYATVLCPFQADNACKKNKVCKNGLTVAIMTSRPTDAELDDIQTRLAQHCASCHDSEWDDAYYMACNECMRAQVWAKKTMTQCRRRSRSRSRSSPRAGQSSSSTSQQEQIIRLQPPRSRSIAFSDLLNADTPQLISFVKYATKELQRRER
jgi:hypothetical protein